MKKSIYPPCLILLALLLIPVTACTTRAAAEKPQDTPSRQEQSAVESASHTGNTISPQPTPAETQPPKPAMQTDAVSGATIDTVSGATVSQRQKRTPASEAVGANKGMATSGAAVSKKQHTPAATAGKTADGTAAKAVTTEKERSTPSNAITADKTAVSKTVEATTQHTKPAVASTAQPPKRNSSKAVVHNDEGNSGKTATQESATVPSPALAATDTSVPTKTAGEAEPTAAAGESVAAETADELKSAASNPDTVTAENTTTTAVDIAKATENTPQPTTTADTAVEQVPTAPSTGEPVPLAAADTPVPSVEQNVPAYETTLADLISDFEKQGGSHGYEPPPTFQEEMRDLFSPQIFTVALSKEPETEQKPKVSRMVAVEEKQRLELTYPGHGWVYVGEQTSQPGLKYEQRKLQDENSIFMFTAEKKGDYILHFSYFDVFTNEFVTDAVAVSVSAARSTAAKAMVKAPDYQTEANSDATEAQANKNTQAAASQSSSNSTANTGTGTTTHTAQAASEAPQTASTGSQSKTSEQAMTAGTAEAASSAAGNTGDSTGQGPTAASEEVLSPDQLLEKARTAIAAADAGKALTYLNNFFTTAEEKLDEGWLLKGRAYELNGSMRNIRLALDAYKTLTDGFPQSKYWAEADARIRYITGFYINIQ